MNKIINKTMDPRDLRSEKALEITRDLNSLIKDLESRGLKISSWYGELSNKIDNDFEKINRGYEYKNEINSYYDNKFPWFLYWEIIWICINNDFSKGDKILDLGGSSSLFSYYLASKGLNVVTVDIDEKLVKNANKVAEKMNWDLRNFCMDMRYLEIDEKFDHITSVCVFEHIPMFDRVKINKKIKDLLNDGGNFSITFDYRNPSKFAKISSPEEIKEQFIKPSGLKIRGNNDFFDNRENYLLHPFFYKKRLWKSKFLSIRKKEFKLRDFFKIKKTNDYTFGALFLENKNEK